MSVLEIGTRIGDYVVAEALPASRGELAYAATHVVLPRNARIATLHPKFAALKPVAVRLLREACALEGMQHPGVPRVYECGVTPTRIPWVATELLRGPTLGDEIAEAALPLTDVIALLRDAATVLAHAHRRGVIHRALTPDAIVRGPGRAHPLCITAWADAAISSTALPQYVAEDARHYRAPELTNDEPYDGRADVYALGAVAHEALTLALPIVSVPRYLGVPPGLGHLLERMLSIDPLARPSAAEVRAEAAKLSELGDDVDEVEVELVEVPEEPIVNAIPTPVPGLGSAPIASTGSQPRMRWTPAPPTTDPALRTVSGEILTPTSLRR